MQSRGIAPSPLRTDVLRRQELNVFNKPQHFAITGAFLLVASCGSHGVTHSAPDETRPHFSWEIRSGRTDPDEALVCGSAQVNPSCVLEAGSQVTVHIAFHATKDQTAYSGQVKVPFIEGIGQGGTRDVRADVAPGSEPVNASITGVVIRQPGTYAFTASLEAQQIKRPVGHLSADVRVAVR